MVNSEQAGLNQADIGRALGIAPATVTKCKKMGMPTDCVEAARAWRAANIAPTMHNYSKRNPQPSPTGALRAALALLDVAAGVLEAGGPLTRWCQLCAWRCVRCLNTNVTPP